MNGTLQTALAIVDEQLALGAGGNAAVAARRKKILRLQAETQALLDAQPPVETPAVTAPVKAPRQAVPQHLSPDAWSRVRAALVELGTHDRRCLCTWPPDPSGARPAGC